MTMSKVSPVKPLSAVLAVSLVAVLVSGLMVGHAPARREALQTFDVHDIAPTMVAPAEAPMPYSAAPLPAVVQPTTQTPETGGSRYPQLRTNTETLVARSPVSTFAADVDTASYANVRRMIRSGLPVPPEAVRVEEMVNYFRYDLAPPGGSAPFSITTDVVRTPWNDRTLLLRVALAAREVPAAARPAVNLVFLVDVSGSMEGPDRLALVKRALSTLAGQIRPRDRVTIVTYADGAGVALAPTNDRTLIAAAVDRLQPGGGTAGGAGLALAYQQARRAFVPGGINRIVLATDGDFNVGVSDPEALKNLVQEQRDRGVTLSTLGVGEYNDRLMETLADAGYGNASFIDCDAEIDKLLRRELSGTLQVVAKDVKAQVEFNPAAVRAYRQIGYENRQLSEREFDNDRVDAGDVGAGHQVTALYEITPGMDTVAARRRYVANRAAGATGAAVPEALFVKIRYKAPTGGRSILLERAVAGDLLSGAREPAGDTAFAAAVAAFGQRLKGEQAVAAFNTGKIEALAGPQRDPLRREFLDLVRGTPAPVANAETVLAGLPVRAVNAAEEASPRAPIWLWIAALFPAVLLLTLLRRLSTADVEPVRRGCPADAEATRATALTGDPETRIVIEEFVSLLRRARSLHGCDGDVTVEIDAIGERHAPRYLRDYAEARARAAEGRGAELEANLQSGLATLTIRLRELLDQQTSRDVQRIDAHRGFLRQRHLQQAPAF